MRICLVYDCLFPYTVGGAERWYRNLALRLRAEGHEVTYVTMRQWPRGEAPDLPGVRVVSVAPRMRLYAGPGHRRIPPPIVFGAGVLAHLLVRGRRYDVVHTASFPYFSLLAAAAARRLHGFTLVVDWHELWSRAYWREYLGAAGGWVGWTVQKLCLRVRQRAFCFARLTAGRLAAEGVRGEVTVLEGEYAGSLEPVAPAPADPVVVFAGRHIPEKRAPAAVAAIAAARRRVPELRGIVFGDGPDRPRVLEAIERENLLDAVTAPGFVAHEELDAALARALCLLHPSRREGYGLVVVESAAAGVPVVLVAHPDNAATELVEEGVNGFIAPSDDPEALADAIERVHAAGPALRASTADWFARNAKRLSIDTSLDVVARSYAARSARS
ncbi:MAG TPA: glycosyltransferase [Solirubrobacteraceae bacterium]|nr:glycosyltransferase [Solirubrobacteraceae bacterium]